MMGRHMIVLLALALAGPAVAADAGPTDTDAGHDGQDGGQTDPSSSQESQDTDQESDATAAGEGNETDDMEDDGGASGTQSAGEDGGSEDGRPAQEGDPVQDSESSGDEAGEDEGAEGPEESGGSSGSGSPGPGVTAWNAAPGPARWAVKTTGDQLDIPLPRPSGCKWYTWYGLQPQVQTDPLLGMIVLTPMDCIKRIIDGPASEIGPTIHWW